MDEEFLSKCKQALTADGLRAKHFREAKQLDQLTLAAQADCSIQLVQKLEQNKGRIKVANLFAISKVLGLEFPDILTDPSKEELTRIYSRFKDPLGMAPSPKKQDDFRNIFQLPTALPDFVGRETEQLNMIAALTGGKAVNVAAARGMGGIGKSSLAYLVANKIKDHFPDAQIVLDMQGTADEPLPASRAMANVITAFHPDAKLPDDPAALAATYRKVLQGKQALILLDNAKDKAQVEPLLTVGPPVGFLVTSRKAITVPGEMISLDVFEPDEAYRFLRDILPAKGTDDELNALAKATGYLPLALRVAADFLRHRDNWPLAKYLAALADETKRWDKLKVEDRSVHAVLVLSQKMLVAESKKLAECWQMLSVFPADFDMKAAAAVWQTDEDAALDDLTELLDRSLIQYDGETDRYNLHDLMRPLSRSNLNDNVYMSIELAYLKYYCEVVYRLNTAHKTNSKLMSSIISELNAELKNILYCLLIAKNRCVTQCRIARYFSIYCSLFDVNINLYRGRIDTSFLIGHLQNIVEVYQRVPKRHLLAQFYNSLGVLYSDINDHDKSMYNFGAALKLYKHDGNETMTQYVQGNIACNYLHNDKVNDAIAIWKKQIAAMNTDIQCLGNAYNNLAIYYMDNEQFAIAKDHLLHAKECGEKIHNYRIIVNALSNLGCAYTQLNMPSEAMQSYKDAYELDIKYHNAVGVAGILSNTSHLLSKCGMFDDALIELDKATNYAERVSDYTTLCMIYGRYGNIYMRKNDHIAALDNFLRQQRLADSIGYSLASANALYNISKINMFNGEHTLAQNNLRIAKEIYIKMGMQLRADKADKKLSKIAALLCD